MGTRSSGRGTVLLSDMPIPLFDIGSSVRVIHDHSGDEENSEESKENTLDYLNKIARAAGWGEADLLYFAFQRMSGSDNRTWWQKALGAAFIAGSALLDKVLSAVSWIQDKIDVAASWLQNKIDIAGKSLFGGSWTKMRETVNFQNPIIRATTEFVGWALALIEPTPIGEYLMGGVTLFKVGKLAKLGKTFSRLWIA